MSRREAISPRVAYIAPYRFQIDDSRRCKRRHLWMKRASVCKKQREKKKERERERN